MNRVSAKAVICTFFCGDVDELSLQTSAPESASGDLQSRVEALESEVAELKQRLDSLLAHLGE
ncbi:Protein of uncharacterised function YceH [Salmonella enterica subsp. enterica]|uniref:Protein of uncharacterized function YceH n=1 Tax=Salmonella enterica I TaxID=59201 RepID=A0A447U565_SALET|nr:Protein of uncharacterised function YceH [Salmonella enterica subsp. enterica]